MIGGLIVGCFSVISLAYLSWFLIKTYKNQDIGEGSRGFRTFLVGVAYVFQLMILVFLSTVGGAYRWFRSAKELTRADTHYVVGMVLGIFVSALVLYGLVNRKKNLP